ncbi:uncharacterized protein BJ212DRAFT_1295907 [Suillus subaureus]|uniref:Uncharacterized protein n=1 Tax=Suillus subaureus TaxID=48587 RepID=A0A9P7ELJ1_9AGAM|nr:uncharacterized protein BJ212DRAFT_1295907 [Suillus subaureus]KAG1824839.1 hypothetical protein BJ212DRAFT_1295907 [Suillus subaureus]
MSLQQNAGPWSFSLSHLSLEHLNSHQNTLSPLQTPSGSFQSLQNISPGPTTQSSAPSANGEEGFSHYYHVLQIPPAQDLHSSHSGLYTTLMQAMPPQNFHMLCTMWGPPQYNPTNASSPLHLPVAGLRQPQDMMPQSAMNAPCQNTTGKVVNTGVAEKRSRKCKNMTPASRTAPAQKRQKADASTAATTPATAAAVCGVGPVSTPSSNTVLISEPSIAAAGNMAIPTGSGPVPQARQPPRDTKVAASDVWYFMWAVNSPEKPDKIPENQPRLMKKPNSPYVAC